MAISARNKLRGKIEEVQLGDIMPMSSCVLGTTSSRVLYTPQRWRTEVKERRHRHRRCQSYRSHDSEGL